MASLSLKHIYKVYNKNVLAVNDFSMEIKNNEFIVFVGPSGCGKSTTLRMIAGLEEITAGELRIDNEVVNDYEPKDRNIAMVFQNYALYPHMSVYENMAFSLRTLKMPNEIIFEKVTEAAKILGITEYLDRKPKQLSGGQRQRVALGRAMVRNPKVFLLDEPLSNLDAKLRTQMRMEISRLHKTLQTTFIYVTHDQVEAMTMGTRIVVMKDGYIMQIDTPVNLYQYPDNMFVASFIGTPQMNFFDCLMNKENNIVTISLSELQKIKLDYNLINKVPIKYMENNIKVVFGIRPDDIRIKSDIYKTDNMWYPLKAIVSQIEILGNEIIVYGTLNLINPDDQNSTIIFKATPEKTYQRNDIIDIEISLQKFHLFDKETEKSIRKKIPDENIIKCNIEDNNLMISNQKVSLPKLLHRNNILNKEVIIPLSAITLGHGLLTAIVEKIEEFEEFLLYTLKINNQILFTKELKTSITNVYKEKDTLNFDIDLSQITIKELNIYPIELVNKLNGKFIKEKNNKKNYDFYLRTNNQLLLPTNLICEKLFKNNVNSFWNTICYCSCRYYVTYCRMFYL